MLVKKQLLSRLDKDTSLSDCCKFAGEERHRCWDSVGIKQNSEVGSYQGLNSFSLTSESR